MVDAFQPERLSIKSGYSPFNIQRGGRVQIGPETVHDKFVGIEAS